MAAGCKGTSETLPPRTSECPRRRSFQSIEHQVDRAKKCPRLRLLQVEVVHVCVPLNLQGQMSLLEVHRSTRAQPSGSLAYVDCQYFTRKTTCCCLLDLLGVASSLGQATTHVDRVLTAIVLLSCVRFLVLCATKHFISVGSCMRTLNASRRAWTTLLHHSHPPRLKHQRRETQFSSNGWLALSSLQRHLLLCWLSAPMSEPNV